MRKPIVISAALSDLFFNHEHKVYDEAVKFAKNNPGCSTDWERAALMDATQFIEDYGSIIRAYPGADGTVIADYIPSFKEEYAAKLAADFLDRL